MWTLKFEQLESFLLVPVNITLPSKIHESFLSTLIYGFSISTHFSVALYGVRENVIDLKNLKVRGWKAAFVRAQVWDRKLLAAILFCMKKPELSFAKQTAMSSLVWNNYSLRLLPRTELMGLCRKHNLNIGLPAFSFSISNQSSLFLGLRTDKVLSYFNGQRRRWKRK